MLIFADENIKSFTMEEQSCQFYHGYKNKGSCRIHITEIHKNINRPRCIASQSVITRMKPSGKVELLIISIRNPYSHATVPHIVALLGSTFHAAKIRQLFETCKDFRLFFCGGA